MKSNDSPEIPDRGEASDIHGLLRGQSKSNNNTHTKTSISLHASACSPARETDRQTDKRTQTCGDRRRQTLTCRQTNILSWYTQPVRNFCVVCIGLGIQHSLFVRFVDFCVVVVISTCTENHDYDYSYHRVLHRPCKQKAGPYYFALIAYSTLFSHALW